MCPLGNFQDWRERDENSLYTFSEISSKTLILVASLKNSFYFLAGSKLIFEVQTTLLGGCNTTRVHGACLISSVLS